MSNMKNGFSTLNRWLGKKNKDKAAPNGKLSKSSTNLSLSVSTTNINETSQLEYNRITPLPVATSNAPFEQTFRITVLLPKDQLYVARLGARVPLSKLLELVCENKQLDAEKYEFRNPVDPSQIYSCDLTIGAVGLSEVRLCHKSEAYDNFNADEVIKLHRTSIIRDSLSSSEFSSRNSKHTTKTASPYSSSNSLNSMDSTGMNYTRTPVAPPPVMPTATPPKMLAPPRKKRAAPRPPSQSVIPERSALVITNGEAEKPVCEDVVHSNGETMQALPTRKDFFVSTPNLASSTMISSSFGFDCNGNSKTNQNQNDISNEAEADQVEQKNARNLYGGSVQNLSSSVVSQKFPEPSPRKRILQIKKKAAPAPPPRGSCSYFDDSESICSNTPSTPDTPINADTPTTPETPKTHTEPDIESDTLPEEILSRDEAPKPTVRETVSKPLQASTPVLATPEHSDTPPQPSAFETPPNVPKPVPRITTAHVNGDNDYAPQQNVSKVMLNRTPTPEPRSLSTEPPDMTNEPMSDMTHALLLNGNSSVEDDDNVSKQADSGIGEPVPSPLPDSLPSEISAMDCKSSTFESSSDDDDMVKVYNFKLGKTLVKPLEELQKTLQELTVLNAAQPESVDNTSGAATADSIASESASWNFQIPISPPPNFADQDKSTELFDVAKVPDTPITPKIKERPKLNFERIAAGTKSPTSAPAEDVADCVAVFEPTQIQRPKVVDKSVTPLPSPVTPMNGIVDELSAIISEKRMDTLIRKADDTSEIESAAPNTLSNFSITSIAQQPARPVEKCTENVENSKPSTEKGAVNTKTIMSSTEVSAENIKSTPTSPQKSNENARSLPPSTDKFTEDTKNIPSSPESVPDEEKLYRKRGSITSNPSLLKPRKSVTRADSFHTTMQSLKSTQNGETSPEQSNGLNSRSSSYLSLTKIEQNGVNLQRRRSSSELSIGESPSLQSLEIIKTILNSRKNSLNNSGSDGESKTASIELLNGVGSPAVAEEPKPKSPIDQQITEASSTQPEPMQTSVKELPKVYRYSGPPSINFSTWSERPKVQVAIKNEGDYIFGGKNAGCQNAAVTTAAVEFGAVNSVPRNYRASMPTEDFRDFKLRSDKRNQQSVELRENQTNVAKETMLPQQPPVAPKPVSPTMRMGIPEREYRVPITVKPLKDVSVESEALQVNEKVRLTASTTVTTSSTTTSKSGVSTTIIVNGAKSDPSVESATPRPPTQFSTTATFPRSGHNRFSTPAPGPKPGPALLRTTSITQLEANKPKSTTPVEPAPPFGQNTLRKTGLKEKILAKEKEELDLAKRNGGPVISSNASKSTQSATNATQNSTQLAQTVTVTAAATVKPTNGTQAPMHTNQFWHSTQKSPPQAKTLQSTKLELKLQKSTSVYLQQASSPVTPKTAPVAPPPPPSLKGVVSKPHCNGGGNSAQSDPRDQLLEAIRNFKRDELNRS